MLDTEVAKLGNGLYSLRRTDNTEAMAYVGGERDYKWYVICGETTVEHNWSTIVSAEFLDLPRIREDMALAANKASALERSVEKQKAAISGLEYLLKKRRGAETFDLGAEVVTEGGEKGKITAIFIDRGGVAYYVAWWKDGRRHEEKLDGSEVQLFDDSLPLPKTIHGEPK